jgi:outer membrane lipoprotein-sorting protein
MHDRKIGLRGRTEPILIAVLVVGFAWALASALNELDAAVKDASASLAAIATIGNQVPD